MLTIDGVPAEILFWGQAPGTAGVMQINARVHLGVATGNAVSVVLTIGSVTSQNSVAISIR